MDIYTVTFFAASIITALVLGYLIGLRITRKGQEVMQRKLVDAYQESEWTDKKYKVLKQRYTDKLDMISDLEAINANLRKANEQIYDMGVADGKQQGKIDYIKKLGKSLLGESGVLGRNGIVKDNKIVINQLKNVKG